MKKTIVFILVLLMTVSLLVPVASAEESYAEGELLINGSLDELKENGAPLNWARTGGSIGKEFVMDKDNAQDGNYAMLMKSENNIYISQVVNNIVPGTEYTFKALLKVVSQQNQGATVKIEQKKVENGVTTNGDVAYKNFTNAPVDKWSEQTMTFKADKDINTFHILIRLLDGGEIYWDKLSLVGKTSGELPGQVVGVPQDTNQGSQEFIEKPAFAEELIVNGDLEIMDGDLPRGWNRHSASHVELQSESVHSGKVAVKLTADQEKINPHLNQTIIIPHQNTEYQLSAWVRNVDVKPVGIHSGVTFKVEFYNSTKPSADTYINGAELNMLKLAPITDGEWQHWFDTFMVPDGALSMRLFARLYGVGTAYWDDFSLYMTKEPPTHTVTTSEYFYYSDMYQGEAQVMANTASYDNVRNGKVDFALLDGETVISEKTGVQLKDGYATWKFKIADLKEKEKDYTIRAILTDENGVTRDSLTTDVYRYDRPARIRPDGTYLVDGKPFYPVLGYHTSPKDYPYLAEAGINLVQMYLYRSVEGYTKILDEALKYDIMVLVPLYLDMKPAFHPDNASFMTQVINATKDYPNVYGYMVMDEPYNNPNNVLEYLKASYIGIRKAAPDIPVYILETGMPNYDNVIKYGDMFTADPYPVGIDTTTHITEAMALAMEGADYNKHVLHLAQAFDYGNWAPTAEEIIHQNIQALFEGVNGIGYFTIDAAYPHPEKEKTMLSLYETDRWPGLVEFKKSGILDDMYMAFVSLDYKTFNEHRDNNVFVRTYIKDKDLYAVVLNRSETEAVSHQLSLTSTNGAVTVTNVTPSLVYGTATLSGTTVTVPKKGYAVIKLAVSDNINYDVLPKTRYKDLGNYGWARKEIEEMAELGVVNDLSAVSFGPGKKITRADFAYFLIRALGLTSNETAVFSDVDPDAYYAKEIAAGRALGILKGIGDDAYAPDSEISRQDMMVICARGMRLKKELLEGADLGSFSDASLVADYAKADVAGMINMGIVKGNADGTMNPLGNTTRAEAAIIMSRICAWAK
ncbi:MAG: S-layer homology domain-containing protein [Clostridia bacterium]|nr:S-layer homology domain-containing protein [Clostridia bacterium]